MCLKGNILVPLWPNPGVVLSSYVSVVKRDRICGSAGDQTTSLNNKCSAAIIEKQQSHQRANKASLQGRHCCFPSIRTLLLCSMTDAFIDLFTRAVRVVSTSKMRVVKNEHLMCFFHISHWRETGCSCV